MRNAFLISFFLFSLLLSAQIANGQSILINAGTDTTICNSNTLLLSDLNSSISGAVNDGTWFTTGDGYFLPSQTSLHTYSTATTYVPGNLDQVGGSVNLILVSDDPDGIGPLTEQSDQLTLTLSDGVSLFCNNNINVSLNPSCEQELFPQLLLSNAIPPYDLYEIESYDESGNIIDGNVLTGDHIGETISFGVFYSCNGNSCWGNLLVEDKLPPIFTCNNISIPCQQDYSPDSLGFPIPTTASVDTVINNIYHINGMDACGVAYLSFNDVFTEGACYTDTSTIITRFWNAVDESGNASFCLQKIYLERAELIDIVLPPNYDGNTNPVFECESDWPALANGHPSPDTTGVPLLGNCDYFGVTYSDVTLPDCGNAYRIIREWKVIEWCYSEIVVHNQIIKVSDLTAPYIVCPDDFTISTNFGMCQSDPQMMSIDTLIDGCSSVYASLSIYDANNLLIHNGSIGNTNLVLIPSLDLGTYNVVITASDDCHNNGSCNFSINVVDQISPYAVCDEFTTVSLINNGFARIYANSLDDGSHDDCSTVSFLVKKNIDICSMDTTYRDYVDFCCAEVGSSIDVTLMVTDMSGNTNECSVVVHVEDDVAPMITCPPNITISCSTEVDTSDLSIFGTVVSNTDIPNAIVINDSFNSGIVGYDGVYSDNCFATLSQSYTTNLSCNSGTITRTFTVTDGFDHKMSCSQVITIINDDPFNLLDIDWPADADFSGCAAEMDSLSIVGEPIMNIMKCSSVATSHSDQVFNTVDGACKKILRTWVVVDWCEYDAATGAGSWSYVQEIKQYNTEAPVIDGAFCADTTLCIIDGCDVTSYHTILATDDCTSASDIVYTWTLDINNDNNIDTSGVGVDVSYVFQQGLHTLSWIIEDGCGNFNSCSQLITVVDCKAPTPYCMNNITTVVMPSSGQISIWADEFNLNSFDNCDDASDLVYSFDSDQLEFEKVFSCSDIEDGISQEFDINMWVTDLSGNQEFCTAHVIIQDNNGNVCDDINQEVLVSGYIRNVDNYIPVGTKVTATNDAGESVETYIGDALSPFEMDLLSGASYEFHCENVINYGNGVSALDILLIQKHILDIQTLDDPYKMIAADVNNSGSISSIDLAELQKLVLGKIDTLRFNDSWTFIPEDYTFEDNSLPWSYPNVRNVFIDQNGVDTIDFIAIKVGDVNSSLRNINSETPIYSRNENSSIKSDLINNVHHVHIDSEYRTEGLQLALEIEENIMSHVDVAEDIEYYYQDGVLRLLLIDAEGIESNEKRALFTVNDQHYSDVKLLNDGSFSSFLIVNEAPQVVKSIAWGSTVDKHQDIDFDVYPNPFSELMNIVLPEDPSEEVIITVTDIRGKTVLRRNYVNQQSLIIKRSDLKNVGVYFLNVQMESHSITKRIVLQF